MNKKNEGIRLGDNKSLEEWLYEQDDSCFPNLIHDSKRYCERYTDFKQALLPVHRTVEKGAMQKDLEEKIVKFKEELRTQGDDSLSLECINEHLDDIRVIYLNGHGQEHVKKVIEKASEIVSHFRDGYLSPYEGFFLLCAAQAHDVGNLLGRSGHEESCKIIVEKVADKIILDRAERDEIVKLARVHGGSYFGDLDTINKLRDTTKLYEGRIREKMLAAILRFADELADDASRADVMAIRMGTLNDDGSLIYHKYSESLHTVVIEVDLYDRRYVCLDYIVYSDDIIKKIRKNDHEKYLLDEIYDRTIKMENERRYCMRFMRPYISIEYIRVEISVISQEDGLELDKITYTIKEEGYPTGLKSGGLREIMPDLKTGEQESVYIKGKINS